MVNITKVVTRTGDDGNTGLADGRRVSKASARVEAYGEIDELGASLGVAVVITQGLPAKLGLTDSSEEALAPFGVELVSLLQSIQQRLFDLGAELAAGQDGPPPPTALVEEDVDGLERALEHLAAGQPPLTSFILAGGSPLGAALHLARCICRRAERRAVALAQADHVRPLLLRYLNRLSDLLFVAARAANLNLGAEELLWSPGLGAPSKEKEQQA